MFTDASEDYSSVEAVKLRLEDWQTSYPAAYRDAYMPLSAPAIFAPFVRLELLQWDPLFGGSASGESRLGTILLTAQALCTLMAAAVVKTCEMLDPSSGEPKCRCCAGFESQAWYQQLYEFSAPQDGGAAGDEEADVVPVLVRNIIAPLALHLAERVSAPCCRKAAPVRAVAKCQHTCLSSLYLSLRS